MTASEDGTMKIWQLTKAGKARKYVPNFDRTNLIIKQIFAADFSAVTVDIENGKCIRVG